MQTFSTVLNKKLPRKSILTSATALLLASQIIASPLSFAQNQNDQEDATQSNDVSEAANEQAVESIDGAVAPNTGPNDPALTSPINGGQVAITAVEGGSEYLYPQTIKGSEIVNLNAENIGKVEDVVRTTDGSAAALVIEIGGFFGIGATEVLIPLEEVYRVGQQLVWEIQQDSDEVKDIEKYRYNPQAYTSLLED